MPESNESSETKRQNVPENQKMRVLRGEEEHNGSIWTHPYMLYVVLTMALFVFLLTVAYLALQNDWIPRR